MKKHSARHVRLVRDDAVREDLGSTVQLSRILIQGGGATLAGVFKFIAADVDEQRHDVLDGLGRVESLDVAGFDGGNEREIADSLGSSQVGRKAAFHLVIVLEKLLDGVGEVDHGPEVLEGGLLDVDLSLLHDFGKDTFLHNRPGGFLLGLALGLLDLVLGIAWSHVGMGRDND